jgi:carboxymethylenebutenolidase
MEDHAMTTTELKLSTRDGSTLGAYVAHPDASTDTQAAVIVLQEIFGVNPHIRSVTERFAAAGYLALAPDLFHRTAPGFIGSYTDFESGRKHAFAMTAEGVRADLEAAYQWLDEHCRDHRIAVVGYCMGGALSIAANALLPVRCAISYYGAPSYVGKFAGESFASKLHGPQMLYWGGLDTHIDLAARTQLTEALRNAHKPFVNVEFSSADHGFNCDARASYNADAAHQAWGMTLGFLHQHLN